MTVTNKIFSNLVFGLVIIGTVATSAYAGNQLIKSFPEVKTSLKQAQSFNSNPTPATGNGSGNGTESGSNGGTTNKLQCLVTVSGKTYDVYNLRNSHSGGDVFVCNTDMTNTFNSFHGMNFGLIAKYLVSNTQVSNFPTNTTGTNSGSSTSTGSKATSTGMTLAQLAKHNTSSSCYVAYNGIVYNVSGNIAWSGCTHHGVSGGTDITKSFPHSTSYLSTLPVVGKLTKSQSTSSGSNTGSTSNRDDDDENENEREHEEERENEDEHEFEFED